MKIIDEMSSLVYANKIYEYNDICFGCSKWLNFINQRQVKGMKVLIFADVDERLFFLLIALLSTRSAYIPVDTKTPIERVNNIIEQAKPDIIVSSKKYGNYFLNENVFFIEDYETLSNDILFTNRWGEGIAYCIFTSGSTGKPKGVIIDKKAFQSFIIGTSKAVNMTDCQSILCITSIAFDIFGLESIYALHQGKRVFLTGEAQRKSPRLLMNFILENNIDCIQMTPSRLRVLQYVDPVLESLQNVKIIIVGGEDFPSNLLSELQTKLNSRIYNAYGPSEATIWVSYSELTENEVNIGTPMPGTRFYVLNEAGAIVEDDSVGELYIGGNNLACGYLSNDAETRAKFIDSKICEERIYKTGDLCRKSNGKYYWIGRVDNQVKIRGYRIEMEEVEKVVLMYEGVKEAIVYLHKDEDVAKQCLIAVVVPNEAFEEEKYKKHLTTYLPEYMIPQCVRQMDKFPYTISGKVDRAAIQHSIEECSQKHRKYPNGVVMGDFLTDE